MSNYAKIVIPLNCFTMSGGKAMLNGCEVKNIRLREDGQYGFEANIHNGWYPFRTPHDLPAFTDKGRIERDTRNTLARGRPALGRERTTKKLPPLRVTDEQYTWMMSSCASVDETPSEFIRRALYQCGMPGRLKK